MTITIGQGAEIILAFVGGAITVVLALVLLVAFGNWHVHMEWMSPSRAAGLRRFFKLLFFPVLGVVVTNAATWTATLLVSGLHVDPALANAGGLIVGAAIGGVHQTVSWQSAGGVEPPAPLMTPPQPPFPASIPAMGPGTATTTVSQSKGDE
jgi:hypothetical protein